MSNQAPIQLDQLFRYWRDLPHQRAAIPLLEADLSQLGYQAAMRRDRPWFQTWSQAGKQADRIQLAVPYFSQNDNASGTGYRECFSSSCAMVAAFHGKLTGGDDAYNKARARYGDTTDAQAQVQTLRALGLDARLVTTAATALLRGELDAGRPIAVGWLHRGPLNAPSGGGHWSVVIGCTADDWIHHDPNGEADIINGGYLNHTGGKAVVYSERWVRRWEADGPATGWAMLIRPLA
jgi:hypothetical protein